MRRWGWCLLVAGLLAVGYSAGLRAAGQISVVMDDGTVVKGTLLGVDQGTVTIQKANGKSVDLDQSQVKKAFDADGNAVSLGGAAAQAKAVANDSDDQDEQVVPRDRRHRAQKAAPRRSSLQGRKTAGNVLFWSGTGVALVGFCVALYGVDQESAATSTYYSNYGGAGSSYYTIDGYPGYYTYDQYTQYYYGQGVAYTGIGIGCVGIICMTVGLIITPSARQMQQDALLDFHDGKVDLGVPPMEMDRTRGTRTTLAMVHF
ncbi:MAG TPA: hypothetical protein VNZ67_14515 [bacterium]|jgi:hypothetical protein|nr:hypothetical protein [bacterium]